MLFHFYAHMIFYIFILVIFGHILFTMFTYMPVCVTQLLLSSGWLIEQTDQLLSCFYCVTTYFFCLS